MIVILGNCQPCPRVSRQKCVCGKKEAERSCASPVWHCDQVSVGALWGVLKSVQMEDWREHSAC